MPYNACGTKDTMDYGIISLWRHWTQEIGIIFVGLLFGLFVSDTLTQLMLLMKIFFSLAE